MNLELEVEKKITYLIQELNLKNYKLVIDQINQLIESEYNIPIIYNLLGAAYSNINKHTEAINAYKKGLILDSVNEEIIRNLLKSYIKV